jgi:hypothetical protein
MNTKKMWFGFTLSSLFALFFLAGLTSAAPNGANVTELRTETALNDSVGSDNAFAGNISEVNLIGTATTQTWQGYFGNVSGTIQLADASDNMMYNWSLASPQGEVYTSTNSTITWTNIQCFNFTAAGNLSTGGEVPGETSLYGMNLSMIEAQFGIGLSDVDGINETFNLLGSGHNQFYTASREFGVGECANTRIYSNVGQGEDNKFEEVLLYEPATTSVVFASILNEDVSGFDNRTHDFEMIVPENGHDGNTATTPYYFFVELE